MHANEIMKRSRGTARRTAGTVPDAAQFSLSSGKPSAKKQMKQLKRLRRIQTAVDIGAQGDSVLIRTFVPSVPPPGRTLPGRQVETTMWRVSTGEATLRAETGAGVGAGHGAMRGMVQQLAAIPVRAEDTARACSADASNAGDTDTPASAFVVTR